MPRRDALRARLGRIVPYAALLCGAVYLYWNAGQFASLGRPPQLGPDFWPRAVLGLLILVCASAIARQLLLPAAADASPAPAADAAEAQDRPTPRSHPWRLVAGVALSAAYVASLEWLGFFLATALYLALFMLLGRYRRPWVVATVSLLGSLAFVFVFMKIVYVSLPLGVGPFQQLSIAVMSLLDIR
jgi:putative tricarboxylic transport membrane protein